MELEKRHLSILLLCRITHFTERFGGKTREGCLKRE